MVYCLLQNIRSNEVDTAVNHGNSGGGLFDESGKLIGIVNAKTEDEAVENIGYARPGKVCIYNVDIMEEAVSILALGAGSASKRVLPAQGKIERFIGLKDIPSYLARVEEMAAKKAVLFAQG